MEASAAKKVTFRDECPYCFQSFKLSIEVELRADGLSNFLIRPHPNCPEFLVFVDANGRIRGTQTIDSNYAAQLAKGDTNKSEQESFLKLFEDESNNAVFYHIQKIGDGEIFKAHTGVLHATKVQYHQLLRSEFYRTWLRNFYDLKLEFGFFFYNETIVVSLNLYDMYRFTVGFEFGSLPLEKLADSFDFIKGKAVALGERLIS
jgi:hypothetical protein